MKRKEYTQRHAQPSVTDRKLNNLQQKGIISKTTETG